MSETPIHLAIPSYNNADGLKKLLKQVNQQDFASITVMDDGSNDETPTMMEVFPSIKYIRTKENNGSVAAKNLILQSRPENGWILFIDSDMEIVTDNIPIKLHNFIAKHPKAGGGVGLIQNEAGTPMWFTKGYDLNPFRMLMDLVFRNLIRVTPEKSFVRKILLKMATPFSVENFTASERKIDWGAEGFFFVKSELFKKFGGFESKYRRNHEGPDLCLKLRKTGHQVWSFPGIIIIHHDQHTHSSFYRHYHWWRSYAIYLYKNPSRILFWGWPRP